MLPVMRRPWRVAKALALLPFGQVQQALERTRMLIDRPMNIAECREPPRHRDEREISRVDRKDLVPGDRRGDACRGVGRTE